MDYKSRLEKIEQCINSSDLFNEKPFTNYSEEELKKYIKNSCERTHKEHNIKSYSDAKRYWNSMASIDALSKEENKFYTQMEREYFNGDYDISQVQQ